MAISLFVLPGANATGEVANNEPLSKFITDISTYEDNDSISVAITCSTLLNYVSVKQLLPPGLLLYFPETSLRLAKTEYDIDNAIIDTIKAGKLTEKGRSSITIFLKKDLPYQINREGDVVRVVFTRGAETETETETAESMLPEPSIENKLINIIPETLQDRFKMVVRTRRRIENIKTITLTDPPRIVLDLYDVKSDRKSRQTKIQVKSRWVTNIRYLAYPQKVRVVLDTKAEYLSAFRTEALDNGLIVLVGSNIKTP